ncbi:MAG: ATP-binding cassette domain-containing protein [Proteobacteria bacterium]|nr:ATP-binding cassette domain-containing protein [Pseudomonadota bacterium]
MNTKEFTEFVLKHAGKKRWFILWAAMGNGLSMAVLMYTLIMGVEGYAETGQVPLRALGLFGASLALFYLLQAKGGDAAVASTINALNLMEKRVCDKLRRIDYAGFKDFEPGLIYTALGSDKVGMIMASRFLVPTLSGIVVVIFTGVYLAFISLPALGMVAASLAFVIYVRYGIHRRIHNRSVEDRKATEKFTASLSDILDGFSELKMNRSRSEHMFTEKVAPGIEYKHDRIKGTEALQMRSLAIEQATLFLPLGLIVFLLPNFFGVNAQDLVRIISVTMVAIWPAFSLVQFGPMAYGAGRAIDGMREIEKKLEENRLEPELGQGPTPVPPEFKTIGTHSMTYAYPAQPGQEPFGITIKDFWLKQGELTIVSGGNGSGKTTLMRVLAGLTFPTTGSFYVDETSSAQVGEHNYRALFSIIFPDFHLFDRFYGLTVDPEQFNTWTKRLHLGDKIKEGRILVNDLSSGQRKRMALLTAILENRPVLLLDEVAADFDPGFREMFYRKILPLLKEEGRTIFAISHDDRYYDVADQLLTMVYGSFIHEKE